MHDNTIQLAGDVVDAAALHLPRAAAFARFVASGVNPSLVVDECRRTESGLETIRITVFPEVPQRPVYDIHYAEPIAVVFGPEDHLLPDVLALRRDFPEVPHLNLRREVIPKSLCLFAERAEELNLRWSPPLLAERILWWLHETAYGTLHKDDQALEPFIGGVPRPLIVPPDVCASGSADQLLAFSFGSVTGTEVLIAGRPADLPNGINGARFVFLPFALPPQAHGIINIEPGTLQELHNLCLGAGFDLVHELGSNLRNNYHSMDATATGTILLIGIPKTRQSGGDVESIDFYGMRCGEISLTEEGEGVLHDISPGRLGEILNVLGRSEQTYVPLMTTGNASANEVSRIKTDLLIPHTVLTPERAARLSGIGDRVDVNIMAIGMGALGSQVFANLTREGFGQWTVIDSDYIAPHNVVRHAVFGRRFGLPKAHEVAARANAMFAWEPVAMPLAVDVLAPGDHAAQVAKVAKGAALIVDMSASVAVARHITLDVASDAQRVSLFLNPTGTDLVVMAEGEHRRVPLDHIEAQYLRAVLTSDHLGEHLQAEPGQVRVGASCRDVSSKISQERVALHAAIGARALRRIVHQSEAMLSIWQCDPEWMTVERLDIVLGVPYTHQMGTWMIITDSVLIDKVQEFRASKLPSETCGVLLGYFDMLHRRVYVCDALAAPVDSTEALDSCRRGVSGLRDAVDSAATRTRGQVTYVGEWHSHPDRTACRPSSRDKAQLAWIEELMHVEGKPAIILIACERKHVRFLLTDAICDEESGSQTGTEKKTHDR